MKLTIILTVYNKEQYLERVLKSLLNQQNVQKDDYEVLAVNDGSTDNSSAILEVYARKDKRLRILTQHNQGLSMARNNGVDEAKGDYVWFVDADDVIELHSVFLICELISSKPDVIPIYARTEGVQKIRNCINPNVHSGRDIIEFGWEHCAVFWIFKKEFLIANGLRFMQGIYHEDVEFTPRMLYKAGSVSVLPKILYTVYRTEGSITTTPNPKRSYDLLIVAGSIYRLVEENSEWETKAGRNLCYRGAMSMCQSFKIMGQLNKKEKKRFNQSFYDHKKLIKMFLYSKSPRYVILGILLSLFPRHSVWCYNFSKIFGGA